jgi:hypothetical protein
VLDVQWVPLLHRTPTTVISTGIAIEFADLGGQIAVDDVYEGDDVALLRCVTGNDTNCNSATGGTPLTRDVCTKCPASTTHR